MMQAKLYAFLNRPDLTFYKYPKSDVSLPAIYARAIANYRIPDLDAALPLIDQLIESEPNNPYFHELKGQVLFENAHVAESIPSHAKAVELMPNAPLLRIGLAQAMIATEDASLSHQAIAHLQKALQLEPTNSFAWYLAATAYAKEGMIGQADLATAERYFNNRDMRGALDFATRARVNLTKGTPQWQRAMDIVEIAASSSPDMRQR